MSLHPDLSDGSLFDVFEDVRNDSSPTNWVIYGYVPKTEKIKVEATGTGGLDEVIDHLSDGKVHYCFIRFKINEVYKFVYIAWCGEGVAGLRKGSFTNHAIDMGKFLDGFHVQINARNESDLDEKDIIARLSRATGSHGRQSNKARFQGAASQSSPPASSQPAQKKEESLISKEERDAFWNQQRQIDETTKQQNAYVPQRAAPEYTSAGSASNLREKFSNPSSFERPVQRTAPSVPPPAPAPAPYTPEPAYQEPEPAYQEPDFQEPAYEEQYEEPAYDQGEEAPAESYDAGGSGLQCRALYDYPGENEGDLAFSEGDIISVLDQSDPSGWWQGTVHGATGYFPSNFVELI